MIYSKRQFFARTVTTYELLISPDNCTPNAQGGEHLRTLETRIHQSPRHLAGWKDHYANYFFEDSFLRFAQNAFILLDWAFRAAAVMPLPRPFVLGAAV